jgi:hypothetical protein
LFNAFNEAADCRARLVAAVLPLSALLLCASPDLRADEGRDGGSLRGCGSVIDGHGASVSGRAGGGAVASRFRECPQPAPKHAEDKPRAPATSAPPEAPSKRSESAHAAPAPASVSILSGQVSMPAPIQTPSALSGDLARASATVVTGGVLIWLLHSGLWASLLVLGVPIWRHVDLLAIVAQSGDASAEAVRETGDDRALAQMLDASRVSTDDSGRGAS